MTRGPAEPLRLDYLIKAGAIHAMTGETYRPLRRAVVSRDQLDSQALLGVAAQQTGRLRDHAGR